MTPVAGSEQVAAGTKRANVVEEGDTLRQARTIITNTLQLQLNRSCLSRQRFYRNSQLNNDNVLQEILDFSWSLEVRFTV